MVPLIHFLHKFNIVAPKHKTTTNNDETLFVF